MEWNIGYSPVVYSLHAWIYYEILFSARIIFYISKVDIHSFKVYSPAPWNVKQNKTKTPSSFAQIRQWYIRLLGIIVQWTAPYFF